MVLFPWYLCIASTWITPIHCAYHLICCDEHHHKNECLAKVPAQAGDNCDTGVCCDESQVSSVSMVSVHRLHMDHAMVMLSGGTATIAGIRERMTRELTACSASPPPLPPSSSPPLLSSPLLSSSAGRCLRRWISEEAAGGGREIGCKEEFCAKNRVARCPESLYSSLGRTCKDTVALADVMRDSGIDKRNLHESCSLAGNSCCGYHAACWNAIVKTFSSEHCI